MNTDSGLYMGGGGGRGVEVEAPVLFWTPAILFHRNITNSMNVILIIYFSGSSTQNLFILAK
jgi:hypothetical protein